MAEYIEREAAIANRREYNLGGSYDNTELAVPVDAINSIPAADVREVVRGKWKEKEKDGVWWYACSVCGEHIPKGRWGQEWHSNFCPNCGADMREES